MSMPFIVSIIIVLVLAASVGYVLYARNKHRESVIKYNSPEAYQQAAVIKDTLLAKKFRAITKQMQGAPVDAFTQCANITTWRDQEKPAEVTAAKTSVGIKPKYRETDHAAFLVLSNDELHYLFFQDGEAKEHLVFDRKRLLSAGTSTFNHTDKVTRSGAAMGRKNHKINIDADGKKIDIIYYDKVERYPDAMVTYEKNAYDTMGKFSLMGRYFKDKFFSQYPHLNS
jgi:hypothetical protein